MFLGKMSSMALSEEALAKIRKHAAGTEGRASKVVDCHYCKHKTVQAFEGSSGHIKAKCKKCGQEAIYNLSLRRMIQAGNYGRYTDKRSLF